MDSVSASPRRSPRNISASTAKQRMLKQLVCSDAQEEALRTSGFRLIAGVDEVGRGSLFPVGDIRLNKQAGIPQNSHQ
jgi:ribonuclease HII